MPNTFEVLSFVTREMLRQLKNNLQFVKNITGEDLAGRFTESPKKGESIRVRKPTRFVGRDGEVYTAEDYKERVVTMTVQPTAGVDIDFTQRELMFSFEQLAERVVKPAAETLANKIDRAALLQATQATPNFVGTPASIPTTLKLYNQARAKLSWNGTPQDGSHSQLISPDMSVEIVDTLKGLFHDSSEVKRQYDTGMMGRAIGAKWYEVQNLVTHTVGPLGGTPLVDGANQSGAEILTKGWTSAAAARLAKGDIITFDGVYEVNPWTRQSTGALRQFVVTAAVSSTSGGAATIPISPAIVHEGALQNVTVRPADNAAVLIFGHASSHAAKASPQGIRFHREAFLFGTCEQPRPTGAVEFVQSVSDPQTGITIRFIRDWDTVNNKSLNRFDVVWAFGVAFPEMACRILS